MRKLQILFLLFAGMLMVSCAQKKEKVIEEEVKVVKEEPSEDAFPEGYPESIALPEGFTPSKISTGEGTVSGGGEGERTYVSYKIDKMMPKNREVLVEHYKKIVEEQQWQGEWNFFDDGLGASGVFTKDNMQLEVKITDMLFEVKVKVFN